ncbi:MAG: DUF1841 family protein [Gammaproteobacteria bacterium]|nr:DUF1841 family protein [Gammaproteobacteria bacterium]
MYQSRDQIRQVYLDVWEKLQNQTLLEPMEAIVANIIELHPEYHSLLSRQDTARSKDFTPEQGDTNPFLHMGMHIALREQASNDQPPGFTGIYQKLVVKLDQHDAEHAMMECLAEALWRCQKDNTPFDDEAYLANLKSL